MYPGGMYVVKLNGLGVISSGRKPLALRTVNMFGSRSAASEAMAALLGKGPHSGSEGTGCIAGWRACHAPKQIRHTGIHTPRIV